MQPKTLQDILSEVQAIDTTNVEAVPVQVTQIAADIQAIIDAQANQSEDTSSEKTAPAPDPVVSVTVTMQSGATAAFVPQPQA